MKIYLKNSYSFHQDTLLFYEENFEIVQNKNQAEVVVINDFKEITSGRVVACNSTGVDHIKAPMIISLRNEDLTELTAVPELCLGMMIYLMRIFKREEVKGKTLGIIGYGRIGHQMEDYALFAGMNVITCDKGSDYNYLLKKSDIISLHITADQENSGFMNKDKFGKMKDGAVFLNSSRPWLADYRSFRWALENKLDGAWFDFDLPFEHPKLITTSHLGGTTKESKQKSEMIIANKVLKYAKSKEAVIV